MESNIKQSAFDQPPGWVSEIVERSRLFGAEFARCWRQLPNKGVFFPLFVAWLLLFQFLGNATFGYIDTSSLFHWMSNAYGNPMNFGEDGHGFLIPPVVLFLFWLRRKQLLSLNSRLWWPAVFLFAGALLLHLVGYLIQQPRVSIIAFFAGIYALAGLAWGPAWLRASFFPLFLFVFCVPISSIAQPVTEPLRLCVTKIVAFICGHLLRMDVHAEGNVLLNSARTFQYEVAVPCSGLQSLVAIVVFAIIYAFMFLEKPWKRLAIISSGFPLAMVGNVLRLMCIVIAASIGGQSTGNYVHANFFFGLVTYVPAFLGVILLGRWLGERRAPPTPPSGAQPV